MNALQLAGLLRTQAAQAPHRIRLSDAVAGTSGLDARVRNDLLRADGTLILTVDPAAIPQSPPADGFTLEARVPEGADGFLSLDERAARVQFSVGSTVGVLLTVWPRTSGGTAVPWNFSDSFAELAYRSVDALSLAEPELELSTGGAGIPAPGLSFSADLVLDGYFATIAQFVGPAAGGKAYRLSGTLARGPLGLGFDLTAGLGITAKPLGSLLTMDDLRAGVALVPFQADGDAVQQQVQLYLGATVTLANSQGTQVPLELRATVPVNDPGSQFMTFAIHPAPGFQTSLARLGSLVGGQTWNGFFTGPAAVLQGYFDTFALRGYSTIFSLTGAGADVVGMVIHAGTLQPWPLWGSYTLALDATWQILFLAPGQSVSTLSLTAVFDFGDIEFDVEVHVPDLTITGGQRGGAIAWSLDELNEALSDGALRFPDGLLDVSVGDLGIQIEVSRRRLTIGATASASVAPFGTPLLAVRDLDVVVEIDASGAENAYTARLSGEVALGTLAVHADATVSSQPGVDTVFSLHLVDETVGSVLGRLVHLVDPTYGVGFGDPWDRLLAVPLDALVLEVNLTRGRVSVAYAAEIDLEFVSITRIVLRYTRARDGRAASVRIELDATFLGEEFGEGKARPPLSWDAVNDNPPSVPGLGDQLLDLQYLGLGQHVGFATPPAATVPGVLDALRASVLPAEPGQLPPLGGSGQLRFREDSQWLIGAQLSVMGTVALSLVFNDPDLYGGVISLSGARAGQLAGLRFEILYRKVTDTLGVYHVELKLPDSMRSIQVGAATLTLPVVVVDVYTDGSFRVDLGFPVGLDFSRSFALQMGVLIGRGGLYFARLDPAASTRVPAVANGTWSPVLEFGLALSVGVGRTVSAGILTGGVTVEVVGILHGVLAWFNPSDGSPEETYHWIQGTVGVVGRLYAVIDFAIIQASVDVTAYATVTVTLESHQPTFIVLSAGVSVQVSVTILLITFDLSFSATVDASFVIGSASAAPWRLASGGAATSSALRAPGEPGSAGLRRALLLDAPPALEAPAGWPAVRVFPQGKQTLPVWAVPSFTKPDAWALASASRSGGTATFTTATPHDLMEGDPVVVAGVGEPTFDGAFTVASSPTDRTFTVAQAGEDASGTGGRVTAAAAPGTAAAVLLLAVENSIDPHAASRARRRQPAGADPASAPFNLLMRAMLGWGIHVETVWPVAAAARAGGVVTVTTGAPHRLAPGDTVVLAGTDGASFRGAFTVAGTPGADAFTFRQDGADARDTGGMASYAAVAVAVASASRAGGTVTVATEEAHGLAAGDPVWIAGVDDASFDGAFAVAAVPDGTTFTYAQALDDGASAGGWAAAPGVTAAQLADLRARLQDPATTAAAFDYATLSAFLAENFTLRVSASGDATSEAGVALFPMVPAIALSDTAGTEVDFARHTPVDAAYRAKVQAYFQLLQAQFQARRGDGASALAVEEPVSMATVVFSQYFAMLMSSAVRAALDLLARYPFTAPGPLSIAGVGAALGDPSLAGDPLRVVLPNQARPVLSAGATLPLDGVARPIRAGDTLDGIARALGAAGALNASGSACSAQDLLDANLHARGIFTPGARVPFAALACTTRSGDTLNRISVRILLRASGTDTLSALGGLQAATAALLAENPGLEDAAEVLAEGTVLSIPRGAHTTSAGETLNGIATAQGAVSAAAYVAALLALNPGLGVKDPAAAQPAGVVLVLPAGTYTAIAGDTPTWVAAYGVAARQGTFDVGSYVAALLALNPGLVVKDPAAAQPVGVTVRLPQVTRSLAPGDTVAGLAATLATTPAVVGAALLAVPASTPLLSPRGTLAAPLRYPVQAGDTFAGIAARFDLPLAEVADAALGAGAVFATGETITVASVPGLRVAALHAALARSAELNNASGMVSRFLLSGLRLPHPGDPAFQELTVRDLLDPVHLAGIVTRPMFALTGQQFPIAAPAAEGYQVTLANRAGVPWLDLGEAGALSFTLTADQRALLDTVATTPLDPEMTASRLPLFRMVPPRTALRSRVAWQAAVPPLACPGAVAGNPSLWTFPDSLLLEVQARAEQDAGLLYELVTARHSDAGPPSVAEAACYGWATRVDFTVSLPATDGAAPAAANACVVGGADDAGAALLRRLFAFLGTGEAPDAALHLLYRPGPAGSAGGLVSDALDADATFLLRTNLSPLTQSGATPMSVLAAAATEAAEVNAAPLSDAAAFVRLLWEASVTRSGGFYLNYATSTGAPLPAAVFGSGGTATLSLVAVLASQASGNDAAMLPFHNCAVVRDNIDATVAAVMVQPALHTVPAGGSLAAAAAQFNLEWETSFTAAQVASLNRSVPLLLLPGAELALPGGGSHTIAHGDTLASIAADHEVELPDLVAAGVNATAAVLTPGAQLQFAEGVLRPQATAPAGTVGFEATRSNPDPRNLPHSELAPAQVVGTLFNLLGWTMRGGSAFHPSGAGLSTTPADRLPADGASQPGGDDEPPAEWYYQQTLAVAPFARVRHGSASAGLPPAAGNPYAGVGADPALGTVNRAMVDLDFQDIYGNLQPVPAGLSPVAIPVGYFDDLLGLAAWPSLAVAYAVAGPPPTLSLSMSLQQARYVPGPATPVDAALDAARADLLSYTRIVYQLSQPDVRFGLETTLDTGSATPAGRYPLPREAFAAFANGAYVYLAAMAALQAVTVAGDGATPVDVVASRYGLTPAQLFAANRARPYDELFGAGTVLAVPRTYPVAQGDTLASIAGALDLTSGALAQLNADAPLRAGADLAAPPRTAVALPADTFATLARRAHAGVAAVAARNAATPGLLAEGVVLAVGAAQYRTGAGDTLAGAADALGTTPGQLATANQHTAGIFRGQAALEVGDVMAVEGDTLAGLAALLGTSVAALAAANADTANPWAPSTPLHLGTSSTVVPPEPGDTLGAFAAANGVTPEQLGGVNAGAVFADGAAVAVPGVLDNPGGTYATCTAGASDTLASIAARFAATAAEVAALNPDLPGLLRPGQEVTDAGALKSVVTRAGDTLGSLVARFAAIGVAVELSALAASVAGQTGLVAPGGLWITPPMRGDGGGSNPALTLAGLAAAYGTDVETLAAANAAVRGLIAPGVALPVGSPALVTGEHETLNSIAGRLARQGGGASVAEVAGALARVPGLVAAAAAVLPVPPPSPAGLSVALDPAFAAAVFPIAVSVHAWRDAGWIDPGFADVASVAQAVSPVAPQPDAADTLSFQGFAAGLEAALPGLKVATGPRAGADPASAAGFWGVNFGNAAGSAIRWRFEGADTVTYALPPLSTSPMGGTVSVLPYASGTGLGTVAQPRSFQGVDLDVWLDTFLEAVDVFLGPAFAVPAFAGDPAAVAERAVVKVVEHKRTLAEALSARVQPVLQDGAQGSLDDARDAMLHALLARLSSAFTVSSLVQVPVTVEDGPETAVGAPRLSGKLTAAGPGAGADGQPGAFSFSTAKVPLATSGAAATFLFSVKSPAEHRQAQLQLGYVVTELELPDPASALGDFEGSSWLGFVLPLSDARTRIGPVKIPVPLRAYPGPATLVAQAARQTVDEPRGAADLLAWDFGFVYQHEEAAQDTPMVVVAFNGSPTGTVTGAAADPTLTAVFQALAQFMVVYPALRDDLALLPLRDPASAPDPTVQAAVQAFATLVGGVAEAFGALGMDSLFVPGVETYAYRLQKEQDANGDLARLRVTSVSAATGRPQANPVALWPEVRATVDGAEVVLPRVETPGATRAVYRYPEGIAAGTALPQRFVFPWPGGAASPDPEPWPPLPPAPALPAPQTYAFTGIDPLARQSGRAGISVARNLELVQGAATTDAFVYRTPLTTFASGAAPSVRAGAPISIGAPPMATGEALGGFLRTLFTSRDAWQPDDRMNVRLEASYVYPVAGGGLPVRVPVLLVPGYSFAPAADWDWTRPTSFVSQVQEGVAAWADGKPLLPEGAYVFDVTVYASQGLLQPLVHAAALTYDLSPA